MAGIELPTRKCRGVIAVQVPQHFFRNKIIVQAHQISHLHRGRDVCDGHECDEIKVKGDIKFFEASYGITKP